MSYTNKSIETAAAVLLERLQHQDNPALVLRSVELKALLDELKTLPPEQRAGFGKELNQLRAALTDQVNQKLQHTEEAAIPAIDVTAPFDKNVALRDRPHLLPTSYGTMHPLMSEMEKVLEIFYGMGFEAVESREIDDEYHMFGALNFPKDHPARDDYDTFMTAELDAHSHPFIAPAHTSTMQHRVLKERAAQLEDGGQIAVVIPGRVFRNEDVDARHEHTFYQLEGVFVAKQVTVGNLMATLKTFLESYFQKKLQVRSQPFYFPFTEPSFEFALSCPFCEGHGCQVCSRSGWIELIGCGLIHPNVLRQAGINPELYTGFAWGFGIDRLVMMRYQVEDIRYFHSGRLDFLRQFS